MWYNTAVAKGRGEGKKPEPIHQTQYRGIAQLVEYRSPKPWVVSSNLSAPAMKKARDSVLFQLYSPAASYIGLRPVIFASRVILRFAQFGGEYNITSRVSEKYNCPEGTISLRRRRNIT